MYGNSLMEIFLSRLTEERRKKIAAHDARKNPAYGNLQELRKLAGFTQMQISETLNIPQPNISRMENSPDMLLSSLRGYIEAMGGTLNLTVQFLDKPPVTLTGLSESREES